MMTNNSLSVKHHFGTYSRKYTAGKVVNNFPVVGR
jgi:hypothetical protein